MLPITLASTLLNIFRNKTLRYLALGIISAVFIYQVAYLKGKHVEREHHAQQLAKLVREHQLREQALLKDVYALRDQYTQKVEEVSLAYTKGKEDAERKTQRILSDLRNQSKRLSIEVRALKDGNTRAKATRTPSGTKGTYRAELSENAAGFLVTQAGKADDVARRYQLCQQVLKETRQTFTQYQKKLIESQKNK